MLRGNYIERWDFWKRSGLRIGGRQWPKAGFWPTPVSLRIEAVNGSLNSSCRYCGLREVGAGSVINVPGLPSNNFAGSNPAEMLAVTLGAKPGTGAPSLTRVGKASVAISWIELVVGVIAGKRPWNLAGPLTFVFADTTFCIAKSGVIQGPPLPVQPAAL